eukprot:6089783-Pleurochrysis_carterae.AAC.1
MNLNEITVSLITARNLRRAPACARAARRAPPPNPQPRAGRAASEASRSHSAALVAAQTVRAPFDE